MSWQNRKVLVTGGTGFIGSGIVNRLLELGATVRSLDNNFRGATHRVNQGGKLELITADIRDSRAVIDACAGVDTVYHLAFINGTEHFYKRPGEILDIAIRGLMNIVDGVDKHGVQTVHLASSSEVYQSPPVIPTPEEVPLIVPDIMNPRYSYGGGKIVWELVGANLLPTKTQRTTIFRPHNVYGPDMGWEHVIPQLVTKIHKGLKPGTKQAHIEIQGDGSQTRSFIFIDDFVSALIKIDESAKQKQPEIFHVGTEEEITIKQLITLIAKSLDVNVELTSGPMPAGGTLRRCPSTKKLRALGFNTKFSLENGLEKTARWYWNQLEKGASNG